MGPDLWMPEQEPTCIPSAIYSDYYSFGPEPGKKPLRRAHCIPSATTFFVFRNHLNPRGRALERQLRRGLRGAGIGSFRLFRNRAGICPSRLRRESFHLVRERSVRCPYQQRGPYRVWRNLLAGVEALGEDLEGFWEEDEAEGGAKLLIGPSVNLSPKDSRFSLSACGGPVIYATRSQAVPSEAVRDLPFKNGFTVQARIVYDLSGI